MTEFLALYRGRTVSEAELVAISADKRVVSKFFKELATKSPEDNVCENARGQISELDRGERQE